MVKRRLVGPTWTYDVPETYHFETSDCRIVFSLIREAEAVAGYNLGFNVNYPEIRRDDDSLVNFQKTVHAHVGLEHIFTCPARIE
ncbi:MAG: hypothetical protein G01um101448_314 [Parcubacteria group bacterium Gr01-1014_48]|nr:MAG: hypothetical protein Greene041614_486 [Parcubacteria group bacterium Greene0416_14]TSC74151.1 MAG: hypothetical protein G01um101448_314 [Parcubacteria group bacterium Gr01-1014_48]TSD01692.1 MAG: hypothetical protein Greene101415_90 [Parcubacteria group bacterium Greene1014_15]TSD08174.1 MAG: hypothetical protein Greene07144_356 [Parcubacteria group bacterium Greene0714_4]